MIFNSITFLFFFFPLALILNTAAPLRLKNLFLLAASLAFYFWGEGLLVVHLFFVSCVTYSAGRIIGKINTQHSQFSKRQHSKDIALFISVIINLSLLLYYKYANFFVVEFFSATNNSIQWEPIALPIGISFFTFQSISYIVDVYREDIQPSNNFINVSCYICLFPQLIAGPIVRYKNIEHNLLQRKISLAAITQGGNRFFIGLAKKVLIANPLAQCADTIFSLQGAQIGTGEAWLGSLAYTLQIYYDFSGYSDMAIGLGIMLGFIFPENFNHPYISRTVREFWRRWHISLSTWFRDYLYIPLGGSKGSASKTLFNLMVTFLLCGFWHGAAWTFIIWGLYHGCFLVLERIFLEKWLIKMPIFCQHLYTLIVILIGWIFFRAEDLGQAILFIKTIFGFSSINTNIFQIKNLLTNDVLGAFVLGALFSTPLYRTILEKVHKYSFTALLQPLHSFMLVGIYLLCLFRLSANTYNPFLYFRF